ncbi:hypothetical protein HKD37_01G001961 [Glycine soja]
MASFSHLQSQMQSQGVAVPPEPVVGPGPSGPRVSTKGSCVDPSGNDPEIGDYDRCGLYIEADLARLVAIGRVYEGSTVVHNTPLLPGQVKVSVEEVRDADAPVPVPTDEVSLVGQALHTFLAWPTHLVKSLSQQVAVSPPKPPPKPDLEVDDPLYLMTLTIPELFLRPYQVRWDATVFGVVNPDFPLYIKHEDLSEIAHGGQCLSISVLQLWILHLTETCMRAGNSDIYGFLEPHPIQRFHCSGHWQMVVILPKEHLVVWFCSLHNRPDNYLKGIINSAIKGLDDAPQPKSKAPARWIVVKCNRQKGTTECGYYVMHWMSTIILGTFTNNWEAVIRKHFPDQVDPEESYGSLDPLFRINLIRKRLTHQVIRKLPSNFPMAVSAIAGNNGGRRRKAKEKRTSKKKQKLEEEAATQRRSFPLDPDNNGGNEDEEEAETRRRRLHLGRRGSAKKKKTEEGAE